MRKEKTGKGNFFDKQKEGEFVSIEKKISKRFGQIVML